MKRLLLIGLFALQTASAEEANVQYRLTGLFQPDRVEDLRRAAGTLPTGDPNNPSETRLVDVDFETSVVTFAYDPASQPFKGKNPDQVRERISNTLRQVSKGTFNVFPLSSVAPADQREETIAVAVLDCKGCAFGVYRAVASIEGVERATVDARNGQLTAWIDPARTARPALIAALEKAKVPLATESGSPN